MEVEIPDVITFKDRLERVRIGEEPLSEEFIKEISERKTQQGRLVFQDNESSKYDLIELTGAIYRLGQDKVITLLRNNPFTPVSDLILSSGTFDTERKREFLESTKALKERKTTASIVKCPKCRSNNVQTRTVQTRGADEASTDKNMCLSCNHKFSIN